VQYGRWCVIGLNTTSPSSRGGGRSMPPVVSASLPLAPVRARLGDARAAAVLAVVVVAAAASVASFASPAERLSVDGARSDGGGMAVESAVAVHAVEELAPKAATRKGLVAAAGVLIGDAPPAMDRLSPTAPSDNDCQRTGVAAESVVRFRDGDGEDAPPSDECGAALLGLRLAHAFPRTPANTLSSMPSAAASERPTSLMMSLALKTRIIAALAKMADATSGRVTYPTTVR
jgi:hypothetical protein